MLLCVRLVCSPHNRLCVRTSSSSVPRPALHALGVTRCRQVDSLKQFYGTNRALYDGAAVLDLCSSWTSHFPGVEGEGGGEGGGEGKAPGLGKIVGLGMNDAELAANECFFSGGYDLQDLNVAPGLPQHADSSFNVVTCALSVDYLTRPLEVFREVHRVLRPGGHFVLSFSNRMFAPKAVGIWRDSGDSQHVWTVAAYFHYCLQQQEQQQQQQQREEAAGGQAGEDGIGGAWKDLTVLDLSPSAEGDPLFVVQAAKSEF